jgi:acyl-CoA synthetase (AMP-forming)/AMP-acid ligase II/acyl carrier protein
MIEQLRFNSLAHALRERATVAGDDVGYVFLVDGDAEESRLTYSQLDRQARAIAVMLREAHATGGRALLAYPPGLEFIAALFGCWYAGVTAVPAYPPRSAQHAASAATLVAIANDCQPSVVLTVSALVPMLTDFKLGAAKVLATDRIDERTAEEFQAMQSDALACLQYTSGSTGAPKGVMLSHANLLNNSAIIQQCFGSTSQSRGVIWLPPYHDMGLIGGILQPLYSGFPVTFIAPAAFLQRPARWLQAITRYAGTISGGPNFAYDLCVERISPEDRQKLDLSTWEVAFNGAEPIDPRTLDRFVETFGPCGFRREAFYPCYGLAEATLLVSGGEKSTTPILRTIEHSPKLKEKTFVGCGTARPAGSALIVDPQLRTACPDQCIGEIWVRSGDLPQGYWQKPDESQEIFQAHLSDSQEGPFLRTGDLGFIQGEELFITGRLKELIIIRGVNHYPQDIEQTVQSSHPALRPGCGTAFSIEGDDSEQIVIMQELERAARNNPPEEIIQVIREAVAEHHDLRVSAILLLRPGQILKTSSGKIRRAACRDAFLDDTLQGIARWDQPIEAPASSQPAIAPEKKGPKSLEQIEGLLAVKMAKLLNITADQINPDDTFARYGLDSSCAAILATDLTTALGREVPITLFYDYPSPHDLAGYLAKQSKKDA